jgi:hypothetical protein
MGREFRPINLAVHVALFLHDHTPTKKILENLLILPRAQVQHHDHDSVPSVAAGFSRRHRDVHLRPGRTASLRRLPPGPHLRASAALKGHLALLGSSPDSAPEPRPVGVVPSGAEPGDARDAGQGGGVAQGFAVHEGDQGLPAVRVLPHRRADPPLARRALRDARRAHERGAPAGAQGLLQLAHLPAALHRRRVLWRMRHHRWYVMYAFLASLKINDITVIASTDQIIEHFVRNDRFRK